MEDPAWLRPASGCITVHYICTVACSTSVMVTAVTSSPAAAANISSTAAQTEGIFVKIKQSPAPVYTYLQPLLYFRSIILLFDKRLKSNLLLSALAAAGSVQ